VRGKKGGEETRVARGAQMLCVGYFGGQGGEAGGERFSPWEEKRNDNDE